jgi:hypothetical protein
MPGFPLVVEFAAGTTLHREADLVPHLPIVGNGPPGTFVVFPSGRRVPLPTDQIVSSSDAGGFAEVAFGGMSFEGVDDGGLLVFYRVRDLAPPETLSPERGRRMTLEPAMVTGISVDGRQVWPR